MWLVVWIVDVDDTYQLYWYDGLALLQWVEYSLGKGGEVLSNFHLQFYVLIDRYLWHTFLCCLYLQIRPQPCWGSWDNLLMYKIRRYCHCLTATSTLPPFCMLPPVLVLPATATATTDNGQQTAIQHLKLKHYLLKTQNQASWMPPGWQSPPSRDSWHPRPSWGAATSFAAVPSSSGVPCGASSSRRKSLLPPLPSLRSMPKALSRETLLSSVWRICSRIHLVVQSSWLAPRAVAHLRSRGLRCRGMERHCC